VYERSFRIKPFGYLLKPIDMEQTKMTIEIAAYQRNLEIENRIYQKKLEDLLEKQTQEKSEQLKLFKAIFDSSHIGLAVVQDEKLLFYNDRTSEIFGIPKNHAGFFEIRQMVQLLHHDDRMSFVNMYSAQHSGEDPSSSIRLRILGNGTPEKFVEAHTRLILYNGRTALHQTFIDLTDILNNN